MSNPNDISTSDLFDDAKAEGILSPPSASVLSGLAGRIDRSMQILAAPPTVTTQTLLAMMMDNSPSMRHKNNFESVIAGHTLVLEALTGSKAVNSIEVLTQLLHPDADYIKAVTGGSDAFKWTALRGHPNLRGDEYIQGYDTPLYDRALEILGSVIARTKWWEDEYAVQTTTRVLLLSDGENNAGRYDEKDVRQVVQDMIAMEKHRIYFCGVKGYDRNVDFTAIAKGMGIPEENIGIVPSDPKAIRAWFSLFSQSATATVAIPVNVSDLQLGGNA